MVEVEILQLVGVIATFTLPLYILSFTVIFRQGKTAKLCDAFEKHEISNEKDFASANIRINLIEDKLIYERGQRNGKT